HSLNGSANGGADDRIFTNWRVQHALWKFLCQTFRCFERAAKCPANILPVNKNAIIVAQHFRLRFPDRFEISDAHADNDEIRMTNDETMTKPEGQKWTTTAFVIGGFGFPSPFDIRASSFLVEMVEKVAPG